MKLLLLAALVVLMAYAAPRAAERTLSGEYEITWTRQGKDYREDSPNLGTIGSPYESREPCRNAINRVRVQQSGIKLTCTAVETSKVR